MPSVPNLNLNRLEMPPRYRAAFPSLLYLVMALLVLGGTVAAAGPAGRVEEQIVFRFDLQTGLSAQVDLDGGLTFLPSGSRSPLLQTELVGVTDSRRRRSLDTFHAAVGEGVRGGHRGFSSQADDDGDGRIDEDPLDGIDNDQDGKIDEDFGAISDAMVAVHLSNGGSGNRDAHMEYYHWGHPSLGSTVFLSAGGGQDASGGGTYRILTSGSEWQETGINPLLHAVIGQPEMENLVAFVSRVNPDGRIPEEDPCSADTGLWLGVMILEEESSTRVLLDTDRLDLPLGRDPVPLAVCAAESWLQLNRILGEARRLYEGLTDPVDNRQARWIVPPACSACRSSVVPGFGLVGAAEGRLILSAEITAGQCGLLDPDLFRVDGRLLGSPREIRWLPAEGKGAAISWSCPTTELLREGSLVGAGPFLPVAGLLDHQARGRLEFVFDPRENILADDLDSALAAPVEVAGRYLDGRLFRTSLRAPAAEEWEAPANVATSPAPEAVEDAARGFAEDRARLLNSDRNHLGLSPNLLLGWPNPFNEVISIRFTVPGTMREAFVWKDNEEQPTAIELEGEVPWPGGQPGVSVKIYSIQGQELVTLHSATLGAGDYTVQWNGADAFGRKMASGTYFCKLQMDDWSVTRRFVFIR